MRAPWFLIALLLIGSPLAGCRTEGAGGDSNQAPYFLPVLVPSIVNREVKPSRVIYLNREGAVLQAGTDEASLNRSSIVANSNLESFDVPAFRGSARRWDQIVECIRGHFSRYAVEIVEQRPVEPGYLMALFGGRAAGLTTGTGHSANVLGLSPYNGQPVENAIVLVFTRQTRERVRQTCDTAAMEIAHAYGLDHTRACRDLMSYRRPCGRRRFTEEPAVCGEQEDRACGDGAPTQRSHGRLLEVLGPATTAE